MLAIGARTESVLVVLVASLAAATGGSYQEIRTELYLGSLFAYHECLETT